MYAIHMGHECGDSHLRPLDHWIKAVQWHSDSEVAAVVSTEEEWADAQTLLAPGEHCCGGRVKAGRSSVVEHKRTTQPSLQISLSCSLCGQRMISSGTYLPPCMWKQRGLGGRNLTYPIPWDISIRTDKTSTAGSRRKLSHESNRRGVASL